MLHYHVIRTKHNGKEESDFKLDRPAGTEDYLFLHFKTPVIFTIFGEIHRLSAGTCILLSPGTAHAFYPDGCELVHDWMHFMPSDEEMFCAFFIDINNFFAPRNPEFLTASIKRCELELVYREEQYQELISAEVSTMFIRLKRQLDETAFGPHSDEFKALRMDLFRNPNRYRGVADMTKTVNLSRSRFAVLYKELFGISPKSDLINARIEKASYLLSLGTLSLTEISEICGYQSIYHFIRQFRTVVGTTPGAYKKNH